MSNLHQYPRGHGTNPVKGLNLFWALFSLLLKECSLPQRLIAFMFTSSAVHIHDFYIFSYLMTEQILNNTLSIGNILLNIVTSSSNFLSKEDLLYFLSVQFPLVVTMVTLITFPAMSVKWNNSSKIYLSQHMYNPIMSQEPEACQ